MRPAAEESFFRRQPNQGLPSAFPKRHTKAVATFASLATHGGAGWAASCISFAADECARQVRPRLSRQLRLNSASR